MTKSAPLNKASHSVHKVPDANTQSTNEAKNQASQSMQADVQLAVDKIEQQKNSVVNRFKSWLSTQLNRISNTIIALLAASLMTIAMPYLVKLEMDSEFNSLTSTLGGLVSSQVSEQVSLASINLEAQNSQLLNSIALIETNLSKLEASVHFDQTPFLLAKLNNLAISQKSNYEKITTLTDKQRNVISNHEQANQALIHKLNNYLESGEQLLEKRNNEAEIKSWLGEVYYFVSMMKLEKVDLSTTKTSLNELYQLDKPIVAKDERIQKTLIILRVLNDWLGITKN